MKRTEVEGILQKVLELLGGIDLQDRERNKWNRAYLNKSYDIIYNLRKQIIQEKRIKNIEKTTEK